MSPLRTLLVVGILVVVNILVAVYIPVAATVPPCFVNLRSIVEGFNQPISLHTRDQRIVAVMGNL
jgi:hypothetical protein